MKSWSPRVALAGLSLAGAFLAGNGSATQPGAQAASAERVLHEVDSRRMPPGGFEAVIAITPWKSGVAQETSRYVVRTNGDESVLVEALESDQRGQKFLTTQSGIFFFAPRTRRAIRITPLQTLRGQASIGDVSRLRFASDYTVSAVQPVACDARQCRTMQLASKSEASTYARVQLAVSETPTGHVPLSAAMYLASGKLAKTATFDNSNSRLPSGARYRDALDPRLETSVVYESVKPARFAPSTFNPRFLEQ